MRNIKETDTELFYKAILSLKDEVECKNFFEDLCTIQEIRAMCQRMQVAKLLYENTTYHEAAEKTGASTATICRINKCLMYGAGGYDTILKRLFGEAEDNE